jgi:hypothetical protein
MPLTSSARTGSEAPASTMLTTPKTTHIFCLFGIITWNASPESTIEKLH